MRCSILVFLAPLAVACAPPHAAAPPSLLPLRSLRLYETGVGYFERSGDLTGGATLPVPAGHLDDALKSIVVISGGQGNVGGLSFPSSVSRGMARALSGLPVDDASLSYRDLLLSLKGAEVELSCAGRSLRGRIIEVVGREQPARQDPAVDPGKTVSDGTHTPSAPLASDELALLVLTERGEMERVRVADIVHVRPLDPHFAARLGRTLDALSSRSAQVNRDLRLFGDLHGPITFGYVTESPTWRPSYRVVSDEGGKTGRVQGWALLHNDTEEDWSGVKVELVNGRPDAFILPLAAPRYVRRELVHPDDVLSTIPQLLQQTPDTMWGDQVGDTSGSGGLGLSGVGEGGGGRGDGIGLASIGTVGHGSGTGAGPGTSQLLAVGNLAPTEKATGIESGALFRYVLAKPLSMAAHSSALVPFVDQPVDASVLSFVDEHDVDVVRAGVRFVNTTGQTLPAGPVSFFAEGGFAGESTIDRLKPLEQRFVTFGADLDVTLAITKPSVTRESKRVVFAHDQLEEHFLRTTVRSLDIDVRSPAPRDLYVSLDVRANASLTGADALDFDTPKNRPVAVLHLVALKKVTRTLTSIEGLEQGVTFNALTSEALSELASHPSLPTAERAALKDAAAKAADAERVANDEGEARADLTDVETDLVRLREHLKAAAGEKGGGVDGAPFVKRILAAEDHRTATRRRVDTLEKEHVARKQALRTALSALGPKAGA